MLNIIVCGTPGTGKSTIIQNLKSEFHDFNLVNLSQFAIDNQCIEEYDEELETNVIDEDKLVDVLVPVLKEKKFNLIETIHGDVLPSDLASWVFVCTARTDKLYDRLKARNYSEKKLSNNVDAEIFQTIYEEAIEIYGDSMITRLENNLEDDIVKNSRTILDKVKQLRNKT